MRPSTRLPIIALSLAAALIAPATYAQAPAGAAASKPVAKPAPKPAAKAPTKPAPPVAAPLPDASAEQLEAAALTYLGHYDCEFDKKVRVAAHPRHAGYVDVHMHPNVWTMRPVLSRTGALRLEDVKGRMLMLQVANKSMVMDVKLGQRVLDGCMHEVQKAFVKPADGQGLGIEAAPAAAASTPR